SQQPNFKSWHGHSYPARIPQLIAWPEIGADPMTRMATSVGMPTWSLMAAWKASNGAGPGLQTTTELPQHPASKNPERNMADRARIGDLGSRAGGSRSHDARSPRTGVSPTQYSCKRVSRRLSR